MHRKMSPGNPSSNRSILAFHFLRQLAQIHRANARRSSPPLRASVRSGRRIKRAAYASMALATGPRRAWSRAILRGLRGQANRSPVTSIKRAVAISGNITVVHPKQREIGSQEEELRRLVPGGTRLDFCSLLEETRDYIQCLTAQVHLMQRIAESMSG